MPTSPLPTRENALSNSALRPDFALIAQWIPRGSRVLDLGCGDGALLHYLQTECAVQGYGVDIDERNVLACIARGICVVQSDLETGLNAFEDDAFDYVILSQTLQAMRQPAAVLQAMMRIGRDAIVSFPNFGYWRNRWQQVWGGRMPVSKTLPYQWHDTPNIHLCTLRDFDQFCADLGFVIYDKQVMHGDKMIRWASNWRGSLACVHLRRK